MSFSLASNRPVEEKKQHPQFGVESDQHEDDDRFGWKEMPDDFLEEKMPVHEDETPLPPPRRDDESSLLEEKVWPIEEEESHGNEEADRMSNSLLEEPAEEEEPDVVYKRPPGTIMDALGVINLAWQYTRDRDNRMRRRELQQQHNNNRIQGGDDAHSVDLNEFLSPNPN